MSDWDSVTILRKKKNSQDAKSTQAINRALATGNVEIHKKMTAGGNKNTSVPVNAAKIEGETEDFSVKHIDPAVSKVIIQNRQKLGITQKDLAVKINEKPQIVSEYESGKALPNQSILGKLERALNVKLRGASNGIGQPLK